MRKTLFCFFLSLVVFSFCAEVKIKDVSPVLDIYEPVSFMIENKIMELDENGNFRGGLLTTRFDIAQYLYNILKNFQLQDFPKKLSTLEKNQQELSTKVLGIEAAYKTYEQRMKDFENALSQVQSQSDKLAQQIYAQLRKEFDEALKNQQLQLSRYEPLFSRVDALEQLTSSLQKQLASSDKSIELLNNKVSTIETNQSNISKDLSSMKNSIDTITSKTNENTQAIQKLRDDMNTQLYAQGKLFDQKLLDLSTRLDVLSKGLQNDLSMQKKMLSDYEQNLMIVKNQVEELQRNMKILETLASKDQLIAMQNSVANLSQKVEDNESNLARLEQKVEGMQTDALQKRIAELETKQKNLEGNLLTAYLIGGVGVVVGVLAIIFTMGQF
ncbi:S-layer homology domain-containing protein [Thermotoga profunda]|uniref:S-layer homology domain-containing protein n=1 Tax=Thermotoga profunda TaxID=1508420 RepID=UPI0005975A9B|nr:S-layer homology domain-containing protein [Thermotoga profunda]